MISLEALGGLTARQRQAFQEGRTVHRRVAALLQLAFANGAWVTFEQPPSSLALLEPAVADMLRATRCSETTIDACAYHDDPRDHKAKSYLFAFSHPDFAALGARCPHGGVRLHPRLAGARAADGAFDSYLTAKYPDKLVEAYADIAVKLLAPANGPLEAWPRGPPPGPRRDPQLRDGGGLPSTASWARPPPGAAAVFAGLRKALLDKLCEWETPHKLLAHVATSRDEPLFSPDEVDTILHIMTDHMAPEDVHTSTAIEPGQPFRLDLLRAVARFAKDPDQALVGLLSPGVRTGYFHPIEPSGVWPSAPLDQEDTPELSLHEANWQSAEADPGGALRLILDDVDAGFMEEIKGGLPEARQRWPAGVAVGKLGIVSVPGKADRLTGDSTISGVNPRVRHHDQVQNPSLADLTAAEDDLFSAGFDVIGFAADVSKAHKRIRVHPDERGLLLFVVLGRYFAYNVCHFGAKFSAYWWARLAALFHRILHLMLALPHAGLIFVDDWLWLFPRATAPLFACFIMAIATALGVPFAWRKLQFGDSLSWTGAILICSKRALQIPKDKLLRAMQFLDTLKLKNKVTKAELQKGVGLLMWLSLVHPPIRPWLAAIFSLIHRPAAALLLLDRRQLMEVYDNCGDDLFLLRDGRISPFKKGWVVKQIGRSNLNAKHELLRPAQRLSGKVWVRFADYDCGRRKVDFDTVVTATLWRQALTGTPEFLSLRDRPTAPGSGAADAFADADTAGIGGWFALNDDPAIQDIYWFTLPLRWTDFPTWFRVDPNLQRGIAAWELLAQIALFVGRARRNPELLPFVVTQQLTDNAPSVGAQSRWFSAAPPLSYVLQTLAHYVDKHRADLRVHHVRREKNEWADALSKADPAFLAALPGHRRFSITVQDLLDPVWADLRAQAA